MAEGEKEGAGGGGGPAAVLEAIRSGDRRRLEELLEDDPGLAAVRDPQGVSSVLQALYHRRPEMAGLLAAGREEELDLFEAAALGAEERLARLLDGRPAEVDKRSPDGFTALHLAAFFGRPGSVRLLLERGAAVDPEAANPTRVRPLHSAVAGGHAEVVRLLLAAGADPDSRQQGGFTPLMGAAAGGAGETLEELLAAGAAPEAAADDGRTARELAAERGHPELAARLEGA